MDDITRTSEPGKSQDPLESDFKEMLATEGLSLEGRTDVVPKETPKPESKLEDKKPTEKPEEKKPEVSAKDDKKPEGEDKKPPKSKEPWREAIARKHQEKEKAKDEELARLKKENDELKSGKAPKDPLQPPVTLTDEQKALADKYNIEHEDFLKMFPTKVVEKEVIKNGLTPEQEKQLTQFTKEREDLAIEQGYTTDFTDSVLPLIKAEYPTISDEKVKEIKDQLFELIQTDEYASTPLSTIYKGEDEFRGLVSVPKKSFDAGTKIPGAHGKVYDFESVTDEDVKNPDFPFEEYSEYMAKKEKSKGKR